MKNGDIVVECLPNVLSVAKRFCRLYRGVNYSDAVSAGTQALIAGAQRYTPLNEAAGAAGLWHYVQLRIFGSMDDMVHIDRGHLHWAHAGRRRMLGRSDNVFGISYSPPLHDPFVHKALECLKTRQRRVIELLFWEGMNMREVGDALGIGEARVFQIRNAALAKLALHYRMRGLRKFMV
jgi:DNA-directed RNA polymerase specialized sigma subunit